MNAPQTVKQLNATIATSFNVLEGSRAYESFVFSVQIEGKEFHGEHRTVMLTLALGGPVDLCCEQVWKALTETLTQEEKLDANAMLFVREWFSYNENVLYGRVGFYNTRLQNALLNHRVIKKEHFVPNKVLREKE